MCKDQQFTWFFDQLVQCTLPLSLHSTFFFLHLLPNQAQNCPVVLRYVLLFASLLVYIVMLMDVLLTGQVATSVEHFVLPVLLYKSIIIPIKFHVRIYVYVCESLLTCKRYTSTHMVLSFLINVHLTISVKINWRSFALSFWVMTSDGMDIWCCPWSPSSSIYSPLALLTVTW